MRLTLLSVGRLKRGWAREGFEEYAGRLGHYAPTRCVEVKDEDQGRPLQEVRAREGARLREKIPPGAQVVVLDEHGEVWDTMKLSRWLQAQQEGSVKDVVFVVGGPLGLDRELMAQARVRLALSAFTLPHEVARLLLAEQLYRAFTILKGEAYNK